MNTGSKYKRLLSNTALFGISTFSSKVLSFLLTRLYTSVLAEASFGVVDMVTTCANLVIPLVSLGISNAVIRFGLEKGTSKSGVFTGGLIAIGSGFGILLVFMPLVTQVDYVNDYILLLYVYVLVSCLRTLCCQFVRSRMYTRLYALDGILSTLYTIGFNFLFLVGMKLGPNGYLLSIICADALSVVFLTLVARLWRYIRFKNYDWTLYKSMLRYCLPLVPALMFWWVTNASDRLFIIFMRGPAENGLYAAAYKVPTIVAILSTIFTEAWQLSAVTDGQGEDRHQFFTNVFGALSAVTFLVGGVLIYACRLIMRFLVAESYFPAWEYIPILVGATVFSCLVAFLNSVYMVQKRSGLSLITMCIGAGSNLILNALLIPQFGANGAGFATLLSYMLVFVIRAVSTRKYVRINFKPLKLAANVALLAGEAAVVMSQVWLWQLWCGLLFLALAALNAYPLLQGVRGILRRRAGRESTS